MTLVKCRREIKVTQITNMVFFYTSGDCIRYPQKDFSVDEYSESNLNHNLTPPRDETVHARPMGTVMK